MMKTASCVVALLLTAITASGVVAWDDDIVLDSNGVPVEASASYYVEVQTPRGRANISEHGIDIDHALSCPQRVVAFSLDLLAITKPILFLSSSHMVRLSTALNIKFAWETGCEESGFWRVVEDSSSRTKDIVMSGTELSKDSTFTIEKSDKKGFYKFVFGGSDKPIDIGLDEIRYDVWGLVLSDNSGFSVSFVPVLDQNYSI